MTGSELLLFAFLTGAVVTVASSALIESLLKYPVSFTDPLFAISRPVRSVVLSMFAGPAMLFNDAMEARATRRISALMMFSCFVTCGFWMLAIGVVSLELIWQLTRIG